MRSALGDTENEKEEKRGKEDENGAALLAGIFGGQEEGDGAR